jgi:S-adenosylmethionine hydrolase
VGVVHRVIAGIAPEVPVIDIHHQIPPHDIRAGAVVLWRTIDWLTPGVILAVVDPGVGTARRGVALTVGLRHTTLVGPDNGLLVPAARRLGPISQAVALHAPTERAGGSTFDGRDLFAPAAARIAIGIDLTDLGNPIDPATLVPAEIESAERLPSGRWQARILWIDRFGNAQLNVGADEVGEIAGIEWRGGSAPVRVVGAYHDLGVAQVGLVVDSYGLLSVSLNGGSAADLLGLEERQTVWLDPPG